MYWEVYGMLYKWYFIESAGQPQELNKVIQVYRQKTWHSEKLRNSPKSHSASQWQSQGQTHGLLASKLCSHSLRRLWGERALGKKVGSLAFILDLFCLSFPVSARTAKALISACLC